MQLVNLAGL